MIPYLVLDIEKSLYLVMGDKNNYSRKKAFAKSLGFKALKRQPVHPVIPPFPEALLVPQKTAGTKTGSRRSNNT